MYMTRTARGDRDRALSQAVLQNGDVVDREIPDNIDVSLKQAQVHSVGDVVVDVSKFLGTDEFAEFGDCWREAECVINKQDQVPRGSLFNQRCGLCARLGNRLFD